MQTNQKMTSTQPDNTTTSEVKFPKPPPPPPPLKTAQSKIPPLKVFTYKELFEMSFEPTVPLIEGILYPGLDLLVGAPKVGKSFFVAQLVYHIGKGKPLWNYKVNQGTVLYLALEDTENRLQSRLFRMYGTDCSDYAYFSTFSEKLESGLEQQIIEFIELHPETRLIIIDTLQKIRSTDGKTYSYSDDYDVIGRLKAIAVNSKGERIFEPIDLSDNKLQFISAVDDEHIIYQLEKDGAFKIDNDGNITPFPVEGTLKDYDEESGYYIVYDENNNTLTYCTLDGEERIIVQ